MRALTSKTSPNTPRLVRQARLRASVNRPANAWTQLPASGLPIEPKLTIGGTRDRYERAADEVANRIVRGSIAPRGRTAGGRLLRNGGAESRRRSIAGEGEVGVQRQPGPGSEGIVAPHTARAVEAMRSGGRPLPNAERRYLESQLGHDFRHVRIHTDRRAGRIARDLNARAFALGRDIVFGAGQYSPTSLEGRRLLAHELTHVVQQQAAPAWIQRQPDTQSDREAAVARTITDALPLMRDAAGLLGTSGQGDLFRLMITVLGQFFPTGYGVIDESGATTRRSTRGLFRTSIRRRGAVMARPFEYRIEFYLSHEASSAAAGRHIRLGRLGSRIKLYVSHLAGRSANEVAGLLVHEMMHMFAHVHRTLTATQGAEAAAVFPSRAAGALLDVSRFERYRQRIRDGFAAVVGYLNRQPHRRLSPLPRDTASRWASLLVEEVLGYVVRDRITSAIATVEARRAASRAGGAGVAIATGFVPVRFLREYVRAHWLTDADDRAAIDRPAGRHALAAMEEDVRALHRAMGASVGG